MISTPQEGIGRLWEMMWDPSLREYQVCPLILYLLFFSISSCPLHIISSVQFSSVQSLSRVRHPTNPSERSVLYIHWKDWCWAETPILWPPDAKSWLIWKDPDIGKNWGQEEKGTTEDEMIRWHQWLNGHEFGKTPGDGNGQWGLACCSLWGHKESDRLSDWIELTWKYIPPSLKILCKFNLELQF